MATPSPSYATGIVHIIDAHCLNCHSPGGVEAAHPLTDYQSIFAERTRMLTNVYRCSMPPSTEPALTEAEQQLLLGWLMCGAIEN